MFQGGFGQDPNKRLSPGKLTLDSNLSTAAKMKLKMGAYKTADEIFGTQPNSTVNKETD